MNINVYIYIYIYIHTYVCIYIYIYGHSGTFVGTNLVQDKGGPSKGGFLNDRLFSYTDLYLCNEFNGMCI